MAFLIFGYLLTLMEQPLAVFVGDIFVKIASAVLGAGVFAAIMKSSQFTTIFQQHIFDVFNDPKKLGEIVDLPTRWRSTAK